MSDYPTDFQTAVNLLIIEMKAEIAALREATTILLLQAGHSQLAETLGQRADRHREVMLAALADRTAGGAAQMKQLTEAKRRRHGEKS